MGPRLFLGRVNDQLPFPIRFPFFMHIADQSQPVPADPGVIQAGGIRLGPVIVRQQTIAGFELKLKLRPTIPGKASMNRLMQGKGSRSSSRPTFGKAMRPFAPVPAVGEGSADARQVVQQLPRRSLHGVTKLPSLNCPSSSSRRPAPDHRGTRTSWDRTPARRPASPLSDMPRDGHVRDFVFVVHQQHRFIACR